MNRLDKKPEKNLLELFLLTVENNLLDRGLASLYIPSTKEFYERKKEYDKTKQYKTDKSVELEIFKQLLNLDFYYYYDDRGDGFSQYFYVSNFREYAIIIKILDTGVYTIEITDNILNKDYEYSPEFKLEYEQEYQDKINKIIKDLNLEKVAINNYTTYDIVFLALCVEEFINKITILNE